MELCVYAFEDSLFVPLRAAAHVRLDCGLAASSTPGDAKGGNEECRGGNEESRGGS